MAAWDEWLATADFRYPWFGKRRREREEVEAQEVIDSILEMARSYDHVRKVADT